MPFPAGSFLGGFRTPATVQAASLHPPASETLNISGLTRLRNPSRQLRD
jgi:hypothetical protein